MYTWERTLDLNEYEREHFERQISLNSMGKRLSWKQIEILVEAEMRWLIFMRIFRFLSQLVC